MIVRGNWAAYYTPGARKAFMDKYQKRDAMYPKLLNVFSTTRAFFDDLVAAGFGTAALKPEAQDVLLDDPLHRGRVRYTPLTYGLGFEASEESIEDEMYNIIPKNAAALAPSMHDTEETQAASLFNLAFSTIVTFDGVSLINTAHPTGTTDTQSNRPAADVDLSMAALQAGLEHFMDMENERGLKIQGIFPAKLIHSPANYWLARELLESEFVPFSADNTKNIIATQGLTPFSYPYLTDADAWYLLAPKGQHDLNFVWRRKPRFRSDNYIRPEVAFFMVTARFTVGATDWRGIYGSSGG